METPVYHERACQTTNPQILNGAAQISQHPASFPPSASDNLASHASDILHPIFDLPKVSCKWLFFSRMSALREEKPHFQATILNKLSGLRKLSVKGHSVAPPLIQFVGLLRR